ncbi:amidohydrolase [Pseudomonas sp. NFACC08-1]|uniref:amidohydrolase n=1 Tax=Pseudomonas sp. NFACC08-1 TaxID=1566238 RepID=UPI00089542B8|nr:amidohydrolase [Pseudomonas sp. NFACC08-1]SDY55706.1 hypothetical protein SAMN03159474_05737 [Pseudomonas sp. NFACC08-1]
MSTLYYNAKIWTVNKNQPRAEAMLVNDGKILAIGDVTEINALANAQTVNVDLKGKTIIPGLHDAHSHLIWAAARRLGFQCQLDDPQTLDELASQLRAYWTKNSHRKWITASVYNPLVLTTEILTLEWLDNVLPSVPIVLHDFSYHNAMANSAALAAAGLHKNSPPIPGGVIGRDEDTGELNGILREQAWGVVHRAAPQSSLEENVEALKVAALVCNEHGITSVQEASANEAFLKAAKALDSRGQLTLNLTCHIPWGSEMLAGCNKAGQDAVIANRAMYASPRVDVNAIKVLLDGTSMAPVFSHVPLDPVTDQPITYNLLLDPDELSERIADWTAEGLIVKSHCTGYGSARIGLDNYERTSHVPRAPGQYHDIAHAHYISERDRKRFADLGVVAEMSPAIWHIPQYQEALGRAYDFRTLYENGALMTIGTDWLLPPTPTLFPALAGVLEHGDESVSLELGVEMLTINGAIAVGRSDQRGSLEIGKEATFIVLDTPIFEASPAEIAETKVLKTFICGEEVYSLESA